MPDREKVVRGLENTRKLLSNFVFPFSDDADAVIADAIALLKEQEAKTVSHIRTVAYRTIGYCPSCGRGLDSYEDGNSGDHITHFCYNCGQAVKWE